MLQQSGVWVERKVIQGTILDLEFKEDLTLAIFIT